ncbi:hypothetical protein [Bdellovibrio bacteriovorus]|uniref:hypothetical protein n=1 Tax=Bdellovibrio bacteriovorus TaxID=959 RepID=UPI0035A73799
MKLALILLITGTLGLGIWGCPTKKNVPDPTPPEPEMVIPTRLEVRAFYDELLSLEGRAPHIGVRVEPLRLLASSSDSSLRP